MKRILNNIINIVILGMAIQFSGCEKDANFKMYEYPMPKVKSISPDFGYVKSQLLITGTDFGDQIEPVKVFFGGVEAENVLMCKNNRIVVEVPENAVSGTVSLQIWTKTVDNIGTYTVLPTPEIKSVTTLNSLGTNVARVGEEVFIKGSGFGTDPSVVSVSFNGTDAQFTLKDDENITAIAPEGYASGSVSVTINGLEIVGDAILNPDAKGDVTIFYFKNYKRPFVQIDYVSGQQGDGNMAIPKNWILNDAAKSYVNKNADVNAGKVGGMFPKSNALGLQAGWGGTGSAGSINNGKLYQEISLPAGSYTLEVSYVECNVANNVYVVLSDGHAELPDFASISEENTLAFCKLTTNEVSEDNPGVETIDFTLDEKKDITFGFVASFGNNSYFKVSDIKLILK